MKDLKVESIIGLGECILNDKIKTPELPHKLQADQLLKVLEQNVIYWVLRYSCKGYFNYLKLNSDNGLDEWLKVELENEITTTGLFKHKDIMVNVLEIHELETPKVKAYGSLYRT